KDALISALQSLGSDAAGIISSSTMIEFIEGQKYGSVAIYEKLVALCNSEMSKAVLGHSASSDSTPGKLGNESGADDSIQILQKADCETLSKTIRRDLFVPLVGFNFGWDVPVPWFKLDYEDPGDLKAAAERYKVLGEAGLRIGEDHMYEKFNIPKPGKGEAVIQPGAPQGQMLANKQGCPTCLVNKAGDDDELDTVDSLTAQVLENADLGDMIEPIKEILESSDSLEEFKEKLIDAFVGMDQTELGNLLQRALTAAELAGRFEAEEQI
ncbi:MAG: DUF935 family protein, partial [Deltaproteobacteria bacterium]|nr:DUF935 family protein [Deltaproteobacteria bacterium]